MRELLRENEELVQILLHTVSIQMTKQDKENFEAATHCYLRKETLNEDKCADHNNVYGKYKGVLHSSFNLKFSLCKLIPVVLHNIKSYDAHSIMLGREKLYDDQLNVIANNMKKTYCLFCHQPVFKIKNLPAIHRQLLVFNILPWKSSKQFEKKKDLTILKETFRILLSSYCCASVCTPMNKWHPWKKLKKPLCLSRSLLFNTNACQRRLGNVRHTEYRWMLRRIWKSTFFN